MRQVLMARQGHPRASSDDLRRHPSDHHCPVHSPLGVFTQVGLTQPFWINLVIYLFAVGGLGFPVLFGMWPAAVVHALLVILTRKKIAFQQSGFEQIAATAESSSCLLYTSPSPRDRQKSRMPSSA